MRLSLSGEARGGSGVPLDATPLGPCLPFGRFIASFSAIFRMKTAGIKG